LKKLLASAFKIAIFLSIGIFFIWLFLRKLTHEQKIEIWNYFVHANYFWLLIALFIGLLSHYLRALRWRSMLAAIGYTPSVINIFLAVMIGYFANLALPRLGEVTRCGVLNRYENIPINKSLGTVIAERSIDMVVFVILFLLNLFLFFDKLENYVNAKVLSPLMEKFFKESDDVNPLWYLVIFLLVIALIALLFRKKILHTKFYVRIKDIFVGFWHGLWAVSKIKKPFTFIFQSFMIWFLYYAMIYVCIFTLTETSTLGWGAGLSMLIFGSIGIMIVQGGIGIYPAIIAETLVIYGIPPTTGYALGWLTWIAQTITIVLVGVVSLIILPIINKHQKNEKN
jgi:glycosyltransferase 2 family protein